MKLRDGLIYTDDDQLLSAEEFWQLQKHTGKSLNLNLLGFGKLIVNLVSRNGWPSIQFQISCDIGVIDVSVQQLLHDYFVHDGYWIPTEREIVEPLLHTFSELNLDSSEKVTLGRIYKFISFARENGVEVIDRADLDTFQIDTSEMRKISLSLPLYDYQERGVAWLGALLNQEIGGILADEMGLGKTAQAFGLIKQGIEKGFKNILVAAPAALVFNWSREILKFVPDLKFYLHVGSERIFRHDELVNQGVVIVSYNTLVQDKSIFKQVDWDMVICDEAQYLKNPTSRRHEVIMSLNSTCKFMVTGTPIENSLVDLWSLINLIKPGLLGNQRTFQALIEDSPSDARRLSHFASPLILRRVVDQVAKDLPEKIVIQEALVGTDQFVQIYEEIRRDSLSKPNNVLATMTKLAQLCCYPKLVESTYSDPNDSKIVRLLEILSNIMESGNQKVIIFSTFTESLDLLKSIIQKQLQPSYAAIIDGRINPKSRLSILESFEEVEGFAVLCIHPLAGGVGLNITAANHVIHFNRQWNPALEAQATARAHRRGQGKTVFEYLMYYVGTIEEYISNTISRKIELAREGTNQSVLEGSDKDIQAALSLSPIFSLNPERKKE